MAPSAGGQYHWISEFAPRNIQKLLSYLVGWLTVLGWQVGLSSVSYAAAVQIEGLAILVNPGITFHGWHATLFTIAVALIAVFFNTALIKALPAFEFIILIATAARGDIKDIKQVWHHQTRRESQAAHRGRQNGEDELEQPKVVTQRKLGFTSV